MGVHVSKAEQVYRAASEDNFKQLEVILNRSRRKHGNRLPPELLEYNDNSNRTPLYVASKENHWRIVEMLLENGAKVDHMSDMDVCGTALHAAVHNQSHRIIRLLHLYGANPFIQNARGQTAFEMIQADSQSRKHLRMFASSCPFEGEMMLDSSSDMPGVTCWCVVARRQPHPKARLSQRVQDTQLHIYRSCRALQPLHTTPIRLDGAQVEAREGVYVLKLHRAHEDVRARFDVPRGDSGAQELTLKASGPTAAAKACVRRFAQFVNEQYQSSRGSTSRCAAARTPPSAAQADLERKAAEDALSQQETDEMLARVLQEEFDYEAALAMAEEPDMARAQPSAGTPAPAAAPQPTCSEQTCPGAQRRLDSEYFSECFMCPITKQVMSDPVMAEDGHSYERKAIEQWLATHSKSPMTNLRMGQQLKPNIALRSAIQAWSKL